MKTHTKNLFPCLGVASWRSRVLSVLITGLGLIMLADRAAAQTLTTLYNFTGGSDGAGPVAGFILSGNTMYGTTSCNRNGNSPGNGTVFKISTDGTGFRNLYNFTTPDPITDTNSDGACPNVGLVLSGNTLYGTTFYGGSLGYGTVFAVNTDGTDFRNLHSFTAGSDGANPSAGLVLSGTTLYGTAYVGGSSGLGTLFELNTDGTAFKTVYNFTLNGGGFPAAGLILSGSTLYGTAETGLSGGGGGRLTMFSLNTDGTGFTNLYNFSAAQQVVPPTCPCTNSDGRGSASLLLSGNTLYGTSGLGGTSDMGTLFAVNTDGTGFTVLHTFTGGVSDAGNPSSSLIRSGSTLYGTAASGGSGGRGTVFSLNTDGTGFTNLYSFTTPDPNTYTNSDGAGPAGGLVLSGSTLYGTAEGGGSSGNGTVFSLSLLPQLSIISSGANITLVWPTNATGFTLQSTTNLGLSAVWTTNSPAPVVVNGQNTVSSPISGTQQFFRLSQ